MLYWDKNPVVFRIMIFAIFVLFGAGSIANLLKNTSSITDDTNIVPLKNNFYMKESIPAVKITSGDNNNLPFEEIRTGCIVTHINNIKLTSPFQLDSILLANSSEDTLIFSITNFSQRNLRQFGKVEYKVRHSDLEHDLLRHIQNGILILYTKPGGVAERAGLQSRDIILTINNQILHNYQLYNEFFQNLSGNEKIIYEVLRNNTIENYEVHLARLGFNLTFLALFSSGFLLILIGAFVGMKKPNLHAARILSLALVLLGYAISVGFTSFHLEFDVFTQIRFYSLVFGICFGIPMLYHSFYLFPEEIKFFVKRQKFILIHYLLGALTFVSLLISISLEANPFWINLLLNGFLIIGFLYELTIRITFRKEIPKDIIRMGRIIKLSFFLFMMFILVYHYLIPLIFDYRISEIIEYSFIIAFTLPISIFYTIARYRLLDLNVRIRLNILYFLASAFINTLVFGGLILIIVLLAKIQFQIPNLHFTGTTINVLDKSLSYEVNEIYNRIIWLIMSISLIIISLKIRKNAFENLDSKFHRKKVDYRLASSELLKVFEENLNIHQLANHLTRTISEMIQVKPVAVIFIQNGDISNSIFSYGFNEIAEQSILNNDKHFVRSVSQFNNSFKVEYLPDYFKERLQASGYRIIIPVRSKSKLIAAFLIGEKLSETSFYVGDYEFLNSTAAQAAASIENIYLYEALAHQERIKQEIEIARRIQLASLPQFLPNIEGLDIAAVSLPAMDVGGDFYDFLYAGNGSLSLIIGDVSGKGTSAALYMSKIQGIVRTLNEFGLSPSEILSKANTLLYGHIERNAFITASIAKILPEKRKIRIARAGHLPSYLYSDKFKNVMKITPKGIALGLTESKFFAHSLEEVEVSFNSNDILVLISDGILEARDDDKEEFSEQRLIDIIEQNHHKTSEEIKDLIINNLMNFSAGDGLFDDSTLVIVKLK